MNIRDLKKVRLPFPPLEVQERLASRWDARQERLDQLLLEAEEAATAVAEYRDALITETVTGKLDVSRFSDQQVDEAAHAAMEGERPEVLA